jgi:PAS domain S-box-containing protein
MTNILTLEIDNLGKILSIAATENDELIKVLPIAGQDFLSYWDQATNIKLKEYLYKVFSTPCAIELSINLNFTVVDFTAFQYTDKKAFVHCKYIQTLPQPQSLPTDMEDWGFKKNATTFEHRDNQKDYLDSRIFYRDIVENIPLGIVWINFFQDGSFFVSYTNKEFHKIAPAYSNKIHNENNDFLFESTHPQDLGMVQIAVNQLFELKVFDIEFRMLDAGKTKNIRLLGKPYYNKAGNFISAYIYFQDITEKVKAKERLKLADYIFKNATTAIYLFTAEGAIFDFNKAAYTMLGYTKAEFKALHQIDIDPNLNKTSLAEKFEGLRKEGTLTVQQKIEKKDGTLVDVEIVSNFLEYDGLEMNCSFVTNITEKKIAEEKIHDINELLQLQTNRLLLATSSAAMGIWYWDVKNDNMVWDKRLYQIYDINELQLGSLYDGWLSRLHPDDKERVNEVMQTALAAKQREYSSEFRIIWNDLSVHYIKGKGITEYDDSGNVIGMMGVHWDITKRKEAEIKLIENENYLRSILDNEPECVKVLNSEGELLSMNPAGLAMIEADNEQQVLGHSMQDLVNKKYQLDFNKLSKEVFTGNSGTLEFEITSLKGNQRWLETHAVPLKDATGEIVKLLGVTRDITDRKKAEEDKKQLTNRLLLATKSAQLGIWDWDLENDTLEFDESMYKLYGIAAEDFDSLYDGWMFTIHHEDRQRVSDELQLAVKSKIDYNTEFRVVWSDSSIHYIRATGIVDRDDAGKVKCMIGANWDVTLEKEKEQHLKLLESVITNTTDAILITEAEPFDEPGPRILYVNDAFTKMTGYTAEEVLGKTPRILQGPQSDKAELKRLGEAMRKWESCQITTINYKKNGEEFWINFALTPVANEKGWFTHWIAVERDVTKDKETAIEKERMIKELMENNAELKQFSYITTHNLRAPLTNLISICKLINTKQIEDPTTLKFIEAFKTSTYHLDETLNDLINVLIVKEKTDLKLNELSFQEILDKVKKPILETLIESKSIIEADFSAVSTVPFTRIYLESIFLNLITNSLRYRHPERSPIIKIKTTVDKSGRTKLIFSDNGIGMDMNRVKHKIFGFHQRFHNHHDSKGIGLYLIKSQINALKGDIEVDSEVNIGTTFTIIFK